MTDDVNKLIDEPSFVRAVDVTGAAADDLAESHDFDEEEFDSDADMTGSEESDLTPNDIFGLDPLDVLTLEELADYLQVSPAAARRAIKEQNLPGRNIGGEWRFLRDAVANWLRGQEAPAVQQQQARESFAQSKPKYTAYQDDSETQYTRPPRRPFQADASPEGEYRPRQRFGDGRPAYGGQGRGRYVSGGGQQSDQSSGEDASSGSYQARPPRRPARAYENRGTGGQGEGTGYTGGYSAGGQRFGGGQKRKNKRHLFEKQRGNRMDRRRENEGAEGQE